MSSIPRDEKKCKTLSVGDLVIPIDGDGVMQSEAVRILEIHEENGDPYYAIEGTGTCYPADRLVIPTDDNVTNKDALQTLLTDRPIAYHGVYAKAGGCVAAGVFLSQLLYWTGRGRDPDGWIYKTFDEWHEETGLTKYEYRKARRELKKRGIIDENLTGVPATLHFRVNIPRLAYIIANGYDEDGDPIPRDDEGKFAPVCRNTDNCPSLPQHGKQDIRNTANKISATRQTCLPQDGKLYIDVHRCAETTTIDAGGDDEKLQTTDHQDSHCGDPGDGDNQDDTIPPTQRDQGDDAAPRFSEQEISDCRDAMKALGWYKTGPTSIDKMLSKYGPEKIIGWIRHYKSDDVEDSKIVRYTVPRLRKGEEPPKVVSSTFGCKDIKMPEGWTRGGGL